MTPRRPPERWPRALALALLGSGVALGTGLAACEILYPFDRSLPGGGDDGSSEASIGSDGSLVGEGGLDASQDAVPLPVVLVPNVQSGRGLVGDDASLYWMDMDDAGELSLWRADKNDGATGVLIQAAGSFQQGPNQVKFATAVDDARVYWATRAPDASAVMAVDKKGGVPVTLLSGPTSEAPCIATDGTDVFVATVPAAENTYLGRVAVDGGPLVPMVVSMSNEGAYTNVPQAIAVDATNVYWLWGGNISYVPKTCVASADSGTDAATCAQPPPQLVFDTGNTYAAYSLALDDGNVYWTMSANSSGVDVNHPCGTWAVPKGGQNDGGAQLTYVCGTGTAVDDASVYQLDLSRIWSAPKNAPGDGGGALTPNEYGPVLPVVVDDRAIYWIDGHSANSSVGAILMLAK